MERCSFANCGSCFGELLTLYNCQKDITGHLRYMKVGGDRICAKEADLILYRSGLFDVEESCRRLLLICQGHRDSLGIYWNPVPRINANIRYITGIVRQTEGSTLMFPGRYSFSSKSFFLLEVVSINPNFLRFLVK